MDERAVVKELLTRFGGATPDLLRRVLTPYRLRITSIDRSIQRGEKGHAYVLFEADIPSDVWSDLERGTSGKVVPAGFVAGREAWREIMKARIHETNANKALGELHLADREAFRAAVAAVKVGDFVEIDPFGVTSKVESALVEATFFNVASDAGWTVKRMPENVAAHLGTQNYYDFNLKRRAEEVRVELKSLWGTNTALARLIHTKSGKEGTGKNSKREDRQTWRTSSCRFEDQDILAVSLFLRTGKITDFAYALSVPKSINEEWGLPATPAYPEHVTQNPPISSPPGGEWTASLDEAVRRLRALQRERPNLREKIRALKNQPAAAAKVRRARRATE